jgi:hypothetical protein
MQIVYVPICIVLSLAAQTRAPNLTARDLFLNTMSNDDQIVSRSDHGSSAPVATKDATRTPDEYLGIRYNVLVLGEPVDPRRDFVTGECFVLDLKLSRAGYLYVLSEGASGEWVPLVPGDITDKPKLITSRQVRVPIGGCIKLKDPAGTERLFVTLSDDAIDVGELLRLFRLSDLSRVGRLSPDESGKVGQGKEAGLLASRDLKLSMTEGETTAIDRPFTGYAVARPPRIFVEISLTHK